MNLYKVSGAGFNFPMSQFITARSKDKAVIKFLELNPNYSDNIQTEFICKRNEIIPTVEPVNEK